MWRLGGQGHLRASIIGSQLLDGHRSHDWQMLAIQPQPPTWQGREAGISHTDKMSGKGEG